MGVDHLLFCCRATIWCMEQTITYREYAAYAALPLDELARECEIDAFHASGPGGQGVNTADSAVRMRHLPTGIVAVSSEQRSQLQNRERCLEKIHAELLRRSIPPKKRLHTRPTKASKERRLAEKRRISQNKRLRRRPEDE